MRRAGQKAEFIKLAGADHGGDAFFTEAVLDAVDAFLRRSLANHPT